MADKVKQFFCGVFTGHTLKDTDRDCKFNEKDRTLTITDKCCRCGKQFSFTAPEKAFGIIALEDDDEL